MKIQKTQYNAKAAFTLIELAVVLVILGLLVGGILVGREMIHASKLRKVTLSITESVSSVALFSDKYQALPGDFGRAEDYWGTDPDGCPTHNIRVPKKETCNGNSDNLIGNDYAGGFDERNEYYRFWQHLENAGYVVGSFTGVAGADGPEHAVVGENVPRIYDRVGIGVFNQYGAFNSPTITGNYLFADGVYGNVFTVGLQRETHEVSGSFMTPTEAGNIDKKIDDGMPNQGKVIGWPYYLCSEANEHASDNLTAKYDLKRDDIVCSFYIRDIIPFN